ISPNNVSTLKYLQLDPPAIRTASSYSALLLPLLADLKLKKEICFLCLGKGQLRRCDPGECPSEKELMRRDGGTSTNVMNTLGDLIKFKLPPSNLVISATYRHLQTMEQTNIIRQGNAANVSFSPQQYQRR
ncbi:hypothetical protein QFC20_007512, partial [Naganishia adeliensis]